jgi:hypothetical protein
MPAAGRLQVVRLSESGYFFWLYSDNYFFGLTIRIPG